MSTSYRYDVTEWPHGDPFDDIGAVMNSILREAKHQQAARSVRDGGKPGVVIVIPPGDYRLRTQVVIDASFVRIEGAGHGFTSSSIRFNVAESEWSNLHELWPGGSRVMVDTPRTADADPRGGAAFVVAREGNPRISSVEFHGFCIDGMHFEGDGPAQNPENSYRNGKTGIYVADANDSLRVSEMGMVYLEHGVIAHNADALSIHDNFIAECGSCIELRGWGQASKISDNLVGAGPTGHSIYAENHGGLLITTNNVFPRGASSVHLHGVTRSSVTANRLHSFYPGMVRLTGGTSETLVASNHLLRDHEPWSPFLGVGNGLTDEDGLLIVSGTANSVIGNHFSEVVDSRQTRPTGRPPVIIHLLQGSENFVATNHVVARDVGMTVDDECFTAQVGALLATDGHAPLSVITVQVDPGADGSTVLDSGCAEQLRVDPERNAVRETPSVPAVAAAAAASVAMVRT